MNRNKKNRMAAIVAAFLPAMLILSAQMSLADSATWLEQPSDSVWENPCNWTGDSMACGYFSAAAPPNGSADTATFELSNITSVSLSANTEVNGVAFNAGASAFTITASPTLQLTISGVGITNNSGITQNFVTAVDGVGNTGVVQFTNSATAGTLAAFTNNGGVGSSGTGGQTKFFTSSSAGHAIFTNNGSTVSGGVAGFTLFGDSSTAGNGTFTNNAGIVSGAVAGQTAFTNTSTASNGFFTNNGGAASGANGGVTEFHDSSRAGSSTSTNNGGAVSGAHSGVSYFDGNPTAENGIFTNNGGVADGAIGGATEMFNTSNAGNGSFINNSGEVSGASGGVSYFDDTSSAQNGNFTNNGAVFGGGAGNGGAQFFNNATAGNGTFTNNGGAANGASGGYSYFDNTATAGSGTFTNNGGTVSGASGGYTTFFTTATAGNGTFTTNGGAVGGALGGGSYFQNTSSAGNGIFTTNAGAVSGAFRGTTEFHQSSTANNATLTANGGAGEGGSVLFFDDSTGGTARVEIFGNGNLDISAHNTSGVTIGSLEGSGVVYLGANNLTVGSNNLNTTFSGGIQDGGANGTFTKIGSGILTLQGRATHDYIADTVSLILVSGSIIDLNFSGAPDVIASLTVNGVPQTQGLYGGPASGAPHQLPEFAGTGTVQVTMGPTLPAVTTNSATNVSSFSARLNGTVNPNGLTTSVHFQYGTTTSYVSTTGSQSYTGSTTQSVSADITGLSPSTTYHFRIVATNSAGTSFGDDRTFTTLSPTGRSVVTTNLPTCVASFSATLNGSLDPHGLITSVHFQYGPTASYGFTTPVQTQTGSAYLNISANIIGLSASHIYHFRIVASNSGGTSFGADRTFTTLSATGAPVVTTNPATNVASFSATLNGYLDPHGLATTVHFQYGTTTSYGLTAVAPSQTGSTCRNISANISGLTASTTYHFRIVATNTAGTSVGSDRTFTTLSATGSPVVTTNPATFIASFSAILNGLLDPHGLTTSVHFQYGTTTSYGHTTAMQSQTGNTFRNVSANISGLNANTIYHSRIVATNSAGTSLGSDTTFTTLTATGPPVVTTSPATNVASSSATLNGSLDPHGLTTSVHFQYGLTTSYGSTTSMQSQTGSTFRNVSANISGLSAHTIYHFRIIVTNSAGNRFGSDRTLTTL